MRHVSASRQAFRMPKQEVVTVLGFACGGDHFSLSYRTLRYTVKANPCLSFLAPYTLPAKPGTPTLPLEDLMKPRWIVLLLVLCMAPYSPAQLTPLSEAYKALTSREMATPSSEWVIKTGFVPSINELEGATSGAVLFLSRSDLINVPRPLREQLAPSGHPVRAFPITGRSGATTLERTLILVDTSSAVSTKLVSLLFDAHMRQAWGTKSAKELIRSSYQAFWKELVGLSPEVKALSEAIDAGKSDAELKLLDLAPDATKKLDEILEDQKAPGSVKFFAVLGALSTKEDAALKQRFYDFLGFYER